jgi:flavin-dependent dehydrogenase
VGDRIAEGPFPAVEGLPSTGRGIRRKLLDAALFGAAAACGGVRAQSGIRVEGPLVENGAVRGAIVEGREVRARLVVAADGVHSPIRNQLGLNRPAGRKRAGVRVHYRLARGCHPPEWVEVFLARGHELYVTPLPGGEILVAALAGPRQLAPSARAALERAIREQPPLARLLEGAAPVSELAGISPLESRARRRVLPGLVLLGDAAGFLDPITGGGMTQALLAAELLASHLSREFPPSPAALRRFDRARQRMLRDYRMLTRMVLLLADLPALAGPALRLLGSFPGLFSHLIGVSGGVRRLVPGPG